MKTEFEHSIFNVELYFIVYIAFKEIREGDVSL
jgi:hypothetical protein